MTDFKPVNQIVLYDQSGNAAVITSGVGQNVVVVSGFISVSGSTVLTQQIRPITYYANCTQDMRSGAYLMVAYNLSGAPYLKLTGLYTSLVDPTITSGLGIPRLELWRITAVSGGGSGVTHVRTDTNDSASGIALTLAQNNLSGAGGTEKMLAWQLPITTSGSFAGVSGISPLQLTTFFASTNHQVNSVNQIPSTSETAVPVARSGFGLAVRQSVDAGYTQVVSGQVFIRMVYTVQ